MRDFRLVSGGLFWWPPTDWKKAYCMYLQRRNDGDSSWITIRVVRAKR